MYDPYKNKSVYVICDGQDRIDFTAGTFDNEMNARDRLGALRIENASRYSSKHHVEKIRIEMCKNDPKDGSRG